MMNKFSVVALSLLLSTSALQARSGEVSDDEDYAGEEYVIPAKGQQLLVDEDPLTDEPIAFDQNGPLELMNKTYMVDYNGHPFDENTITERDGKIEIKTSLNNKLLFQLASRRFLVNAGDIITVNYKVTKSPGSGQLTFGLCNTQQEGWLGKDGNRTFIFDKPDLSKPTSEVVSKKGKFRALVPQGETVTSLIFVSVPLENGQLIQSSFTIKRLKISIIPAS